MSELLFLPKQQKNQHAPAQTPKHAPPPPPKHQNIKHNPFRLNSKRYNMSPAQAAKRTRFLTWGGCFLFFYLRGGEVACLIVAVWAGGVLYCLLLGLGACFIFAVWAGPRKQQKIKHAPAQTAKTSFPKSPNNKKDKTTHKKKNTLTV